MSEININVSTKTIFKVLAVVLSLYLLYLLWNIVLLLFVALILAALIDPFADWFQKKKIPRGLAVLVIYIVLLGLLSLAIILLAPVITKDLPSLVDNIGKFWTDLQNNSFWQKIVEGVNNVQTSLSSYGFGSQGSGQVVASGGVKNTISGVFSTISGFFGGIFSLVLVLVMTFYMVVQEDSLKKILRSVIPNEYLPRLSQIMGKMRNKLGAWLRGQLVLSLIIGLLVFIGLTILGIKYALVLAMLASLLEFIPYVGPVLAALPALFLAFSMGGLVKFLFTLLMYVIVQQLENHLIVPKVMQKAVGLNPIISITVLLSGFQLAGVLGVLIAIPTATALSVLLQEFVGDKSIK
ncbi:MAG: AI-2E family transporter [Candidatus Magasanikbacteria bacterium]